MTINQVKEGNVRRKRNEVAPAKKPNTAQKTSRKRKTTAPKPKTWKQRITQPGPLRTTLLLTGGVLVVCAYGAFVAIDMGGILQNNSGIILMFFAFVAFNALLIYIGYQIGMRKKRVRRRKKVS